MPTDWTQELFGGSTGAVTPVQAKPSTDWTSELFGGGTQSQPAPPAVKPAEEPDNRSLVQKGVDLVRGRQDPAYQGLKSFDEEMGLEKNTDAIRKIRMGAMVAGDDARYGDIMKDSLGDRFIRKETDKFGHDVVVYKGADGAEKKAYVNKPGLDTEDVSRGMVQAVPYMIGGGTTAVAAKALPGLLRAGAQAVTGALTSGATDLASIALGSEQGVDTDKAAAVGLLGAAGEGAGVLAGSLWRKFVTVPGLYDRAAGALTDKGIRASKAAGVDPDALTGKIGEEFAKLYAKNPSAAKAQLGEQAASQGFKIPSTVGQRTKDAEKLLQEKGMRYGLYGQNAKEIIQEFDKGQAEAVKNAAIGTFEPIPGAKIAAEEVKPGLATSFAPHRTPDQLNPATLGEGIREGLTGAKAAAKGVETRSWQDAGDLLPKPEALELLPDALAGSLGGMRVTAEMPKAAGMAKAIDAYIEGKAFSEPVAKVLKQAPVKTVDEMRRQLLGMYKGATDPTDAKASRAIYEGFNDWIAQAADKELLAGNPGAAAALRTARSVTREVKGLFSPTNAGRKTPGAKILEDVLEGSDSAEGIVSGLFGGGPTANIKDGSIQALQHMRETLSRYGDTAAGQNAWNDVRAAYWMRLVQDKKGEVFSPKVMLNNVKAAIYNQRSVVGELYSREELAQIANFTKALQHITYADPNPSGSAVGIATFARQFFGKLFEAVGGKSRLGQTALELSGLNRAYGTSAAKAATSQTVKPRNSNFAGPFEAAGAEVYGNSK